MNFVASTFMLLCLSLPFPVAGASLPRWGLVGGSKHLHTSLELEQRLGETARNGKLKAIVQAPSFGAESNGESEFGPSANLEALIGQNAETFHSLLVKGANPKRRSKVKSAMAGFDGSSAVQLAEISKNPEHLRLFLSQGGDPNLVCDKFGRTIIFDSILNRMERNIDLLIAVGADLNRRDSAGMTPLLFAASISAYDIVYKLLRAGANPKIENKWGYDLQDFLVQFGLKGLPIWSSQRYWYRRVSAFLSEGNRGE